LEGAAIGGDLNSAGMGDPWSRSNGLLSKQGTKCQDKTGGAFFNIRVGKKTPGRALLGCTAHVPTRILLVDMVIWDQVSAAMISDNLQR
jgi:hypothetical protein